MSGDLDSHPQESICIRKALEVESEEIQSLILNAVSPHKNEDFTEEGWLRFQAPNTVSLIAERLRSAGYLTLVCESEGKLIGKIAIRNHEKIDQLFVDPKHRERGVAKALWRRARETCEQVHETKEFWVKSSTMGLPMYKSFGFLPVGGKKTENGISFYQMVLSVSVDTDQ